MKKFKFEKPFASFSLSNNYKQSPSLKERWKKALHDPMYLIVWGYIIVFIIYLIIMNYHLNFKI